MKQILFFLLLMISVAGFGQHHMMHVLAGQGSAPPATGLADSLVLVWELDETSGATAYDACDSKDGTMYNTPTLGQAGILDNAIAFNAASLEFIQHDGSFPTGYPVSISIWANSTQALTDNGFLVYWGRSNANYYFLSIINRNDGTNKTGVSLLNYVNQQTMILEYSNVDINDGNWHHVVVVWGGITSRKIYIDGSLVSTFTTAANFPGNLVRFGIARMGRSSPGGYYTGTIDQVAFWEKALSAEDVEQLYDLGTGIAYIDFAMIPQRIFENFIERKYNVQIPLRIAS